jgi:hypothetical protein
MHIIRASYGGADITDIVRSRVNGDHLSMIADNRIIGDPQVGEVKFLEVVAEIDGQVVTERARENTVLVLPKSQTNRLGIFYSNNVNERIYPAISASLESIKRAAAGRADIITCMWRPHPNNPFREYLAWTNTSSHLNQVLQILQLLHTAKETGNYRYVSFLEHDVLYAEGYFDYPEFDQDVIANMNYIGLNKSGFQQRNQFDKPLHQLTMRFDYAIEHYTNLLPNALVFNSGCLEPKKLKAMVQPDIDWDSVQPSVHVNHGTHFTSHFSIFSTTNVTPTHPYWGNHAQYLNLF